MAMIEVDREPSRRDVVIFGFLLLAFVAAIGALVIYRPGTLMGMGIALSVVWAISLVFSGLSKTALALGLIFPLTFLALGGAATNGVPGTMLAGGLGALGGVLSLGAWASASFGKRLYVGWLEAATPLGWTIGTVLLGFIYYTVFSLIGLVLRIVGHDPLSRNVDRSTDSYWEDHAPPAPSRRYFQQF